MAPPAVPSFAATTPTILPPKRAICPAAHCWALVGSQFGVSYSASVLYGPPASPSWLPFLISPAAASVGEHLFCRTPTSPSSDSNLALRQLTTEASFALLHP